MITQMHGDNLDLLPTLAPCSVQTIVTSPPYYGLRSYSIPPSAWPEVIYTPLIGLPPVVIPAMLCQLGAEPDPLAYIGHLVHVLRLARPVLRGDGTLWVNLGDSYAQDTKWGGASGGKNETSAAGGLPRDRRSTGIPDKNLLGIPHRAALALQADGWVWRSEVIWHAPNKMPESVRDRPTRAHEQVLLFGKGPRYYYDSEAVAEEAQEHHASAASFKRNGNARSEPLVPGNTATHRPDRTDVLYSGGTRNRRSVWSIATTPMPAKLRGASDAHYAAWPPALVEVMIKASTANKACAACGAAWVRQVEREGGYNGIGRSEETYTAKAYEHPQSKPRGPKSDFGVSTAVTTGFTPACACAAGVGRCVVLDPFGGTGTTAAVCEQLGRDAILIDLGYQELQERRTNNLQIAMEAFI